MVLRGQIPERQVELGREHEHGEAGLEAEPALGEADADRDRHERDPERGRELEHGPERNATRSVPIVARRYSSLTSSICSACAWPRLNARRVGSPRTTSRKCVASSRSAAPALAVRRSV